MQPYSHRHVSSADRVRADRIRQRKLERKLLQISSMSVLVLLLATAVCAMIIAHKSKTISLLTDELNQLETTNAQISQQLAAANEIVSDVEAQIAAALAKAQPAEEGFFDDALFVGDSVSYKLELYAESLRSSDEDCLDNAQFFTAGSLSWGGLLKELSDSSLHPSYNGEKMLLEDAVTASGAKKVYIMLGMNDVALYGVEQTLLNIQENCTRILDKNPDVEIFIESVTPILDSCETTSLNNELVSEFNEAVQLLCAETGYYFIDIYSQVCDENGDLLSDYCSDPESMGIHFTNAGCAVWVEYLQNHPYGY